MKVSLQLAERSDNAVRVPPVPDDSDTGEELRQSVLRQYDILVRVMNMCRLLRYHRKNMFHSGLHCLLLNVIKTLLQCPQLDTNQLERTGEEDMNQSEPSTYN
eukprot:939006_1